MLVCVYILMSGTFSLSCVFEYLCKNMYLFILQCEVKRLDDRCVLGHSDGYGTFTHFFLHMDCLRRKQYLKKTQAPTGGRSKLHT